MVFECLMLPGKNVQANARPGAGGNLAVEDLEVHRDITSAELNGSSLHFSGSLHGERTREYRRDCDREGDPDQPTTKDSARKTLTEGKEGEEDDDESRALHVERIEGLDW